MVWFLKVIICGVESLVKIWRERSDFSLCDRLDREEIGVRVLESFCYVKYG